MISGTRYQLQREVNRQLRLATDIARSQAEISAGGKRILAPSDDPVGAARVAEIGRSQSNQATWRANLDTAAALASNAEGVLDAIVTALDRVNELMIAASNGTLSGEDRNAAAIEIESIAGEIATLRDTRDSRGDPLFPAAAASVRIPVGQNLDIAAVANRETIFDAVPTSGGPASHVAILTSAVTALRANSPAAIATALADTNAASRHAIAAHADQGARGARIDTLTERSAESKLALKLERSGIEDADITELIATIQARQLSLDAAQAVFARVNSSTLFDLLK